MMKLHELSPAPGSVKERKRIGRGAASGQGKTAGKGHKGQKARSGSNAHIGFEGGQMPFREEYPKEVLSTFLRKRSQLLTWQPSTTSSMTALP